MESSIDGTVIGGTNGKFDESDFLQDAVIGFENGEGDRS